MNNFLVYRRIRNTLFKTHNTQTANQFWSIKLRGFFCKLVLLLYGTTSYAANVSIVTADIIPDEEVQRIVYRANKLEKKIISSNLVYDDKKLTSYVNSIIFKLYPDLTQIFTVKLYISTEINAFVLPNGSIFLNLGLLAKAENEAQIAAILAHEGAHYVANHQLQKQQELKYIASGAEFFGYERARSLISDYSRELEQEADNMGFDSLLSAGYDTREAVRIFSIIAEQTKALNIQKPSLYSTHPKLVDRIKYFSHLNYGLSIENSGYTGKEAYQKNIRTILLYNLELHLSKYNFKNILLDLENNSELLKSFPQAWFYLGEAYRQRGETSDAELAEVAYLNAIKQVPLFADSYRALGVLLMKNNHPRNAQRYFERYLAMAPHARDTHYIELYLQDIKKRASPK